MGGAQPYRAILATDFIARLFLANCFTLNDDAPPDCSDVDFCAGADSDAGVFDDVYSFHRVPTEKPSGIKKYNFPNTLDVKAVINTNIITNTMSGYTSNINLNTFHIFTISSRPCSGDLDLDPCILLLNSPPILKIYGSNIMYKNGMCAAIPNTIMKTIIVMIQMKNIGNVIISFHRMLLMSISASLISTPPSGPVVGVKLL